MEVPTAAKYCKMCEGQCKTKESADKCPNPDQVNIPGARYYGKYRYPLFVADYILEGMYFKEGVVKVGEEPGMGGANKVETLLEMFRKRHANEASHLDPICRSAAS